MSRSPVPRPVAARASQAAVPGTTPTHVPGRDLRCGVVQCVVDLAVGDTARAFVGPATQVATDPPPVEPRPEADDRDAHHPGVEESGAGRGQCREGSEVAVEAVRHAGGPSAPTPGGGERTPDVG